MQRLRLTGFHSCPDSIKGHPFVMCFNQRSVTMTDYSTHDGALIHNARLQLPNAPEYTRRQDSAGKWYELLTWTCEYISWAGQCARVSIQTWDRREIYPLILWPHKRFRFRGAQVEMMSESAIATLDDKSIKTLKLWLDRFSQKT